MPITFIPNDPRSGGIPNRKVTPRRDRPATRAGFNVFSPAPEGVFPVGSPQFLFWQCREAALLSLEVWEALDGNLASWARASTPGRKKLALIQDRADKLNAFYDGESLSFFHNTSGTKTTLSGASTDVVAHEAGHALLDTVRPPLFDSMVTEQNAFHEAFGDCMALMVGFFDRPTRVALLGASANLSKANFLEATAEDLSDGVRRALGANHPAAAPRHARNKFKFRLPTSLPSSGPPSVLTSEIHSFGRIFSGCFYDTVRNIFNALPASGRNEAGLLQSANTAMKLVIAGARKAPQVDRFFQAVGRAMVLEDQATNSSVNRQAIIDAFNAHNISLGSASMLAPRATLAGSAPSFRGKNLLSAATVKDLRARIAAKPGARFAINMVEIGGEKVAEAVHQREVSLSGLDSRLKGVVAMAQEPVLVKKEGAMAAIASALPDADTSIDEVQTFVKTLLEHGQIAFDGKRSPRPTASFSAVAETSGNDEQQLPTHTIISRAGKKTLTRIRFLCD